MAGSKDKLADILNRTTPGAPPPPATEEPDGEALTIAQMDGKSSSLRPANKNLTRLHVVLKDGKVCSFQYHYLGAMSAFEGGKFTLLFEGAKHWELTVKGHGPKFWAVYDYCTLHRWPYLREATGSMPGAAADGETVFTEITIKDVTPKSE